LGYNRNPQTQLCERGIEDPGCTSNHHRRQAQARAPAQLRAALGKARRGQVHWLTRRAERVDLCAVMNGQRSEEHAFAGHMQSSA
jgi:hypothetical protein